MPLFIFSLTIKQNIELEIIREEQKDKFKTIKRKEINTRKSYKTSIDRPHESTYSPVYDEWEEFILFEKESKIDFKDITIISGDNGYGKTSLIKFLKPPQLNKFDHILSDTPEEELNKETWRTWLNNKQTKITLKQIPQLVFYNDNHHKKAILTSYKQSVSNNQGYIEPNNFASLWDMQSNSNGEQNLDLIRGLKEITNSVIILDEPETSLSIKSQYKIKNFLKQLAETNQLIIITHSPILMELSKQTFDIVDRVYKERETFLKEQMG